MNNEKVKERKKQKFKWIDRCDVISIFDSINVACQMDKKITTKMQEKIDLLIGKKFVFIKLTLSFIDRANLFWI